jgi:Protein of unknown function (DUF1769)
MDESVTGQVFDYRAGKLPATWIIKSVIRCVRLLAPQLDVQLDGTNPGSNCHGADCDSQETSSSARSHPVCFVTRNPVGFPVRGWFR